MGLVLSLSEGKTFYVGSTKFTVVIVEDDEPFVLQRDDGKRFRVTAAPAVEVLPEVMVSAGTRTSPMWAKVVVDAPRDIPIVRPHPNHPVRGLA